MQIRRSSSLQVFSTKCLSYRQLNSKSELNLNALKHVYRCARLYIKENLALKASAILFGQWPQTPSVQIIVRWFLVSLDFLLIYTQDGLPELGSSFKKIYSEAPYRAIKLFLSTIFELLMKFPFI